MIIHHRHTTFDEGLAERQKEVLGMWFGDTCSETHGVSCTCKETCSPSKLIFLEYKAPRNVKKENNQLTKMINVSVFSV